MQHRDSADQARAELERGRHDPEAFRAALVAVPRGHRDAWVDHVFGLADLPDDDRRVLPRDCVPYLPCSVDVLLDVVDHAPVQSSDVFVDIGAGVGRAAALVSLLTGATAIGLEIQPGLVAAARALARRVRAHLTFIEGDAAALAGTIANGSVFFLYCPFSGPRLAKVIADLEPIARRVCCVGVPLPSCDWLAQVWSRDDLAVYRSIVR